MRDSENIKELLAALADAQAELPTMPKSSQAYGYKYTDLDTIVQTIRPILHKHGLAFTQSVGGIDEYLVDGEEHFSLTTRLFHKSGQYIEEAVKIPEITGAKNNAAQLLGMGITYMRRYALCAMLGITSDEDVDANVPQGNAPKPQGNAQTPAAPKKAQAKKGGEKTAYSFTETEAAEMREMFDSGLFPPEEQERIRESLRKRESTASEVLWATRKKYMARAKGKAAETAAPPDAEAESGASEAFDRGLPDSGQEEIF